MRAAAGLRLVHASGRRRRLGRGAQARRDGLSAERSAEPGDVARRQRNGGRGRRAGAAAASKAGRDDAHPLDLPSALALAARGNRRIAEAQQQLEASAERRRRARPLLPSTTAQSRYTWYSSAQTTNVELPSGLLPPGVAKPEVKVRDQQAGTVNANIYFPLDFTGELKHTLEAAQAGYRGERARVWATTLDEQLAVVQGYFQLLETRRLRTVTEQTIAVYRTQVGIAQARYDRSVSPERPPDRAGRAADGRAGACSRATSRSSRRAGVQPGDRRRGERAGATRRRHHAARDPDRRDALAQTYEHNPILLSLLEEQQRLENTAIALERSRLPRFGAGGGWTTRPATS